MPGARGPLSSGAGSSYYERAGSGDPLVLLHPGGVDSRVFASLVPGLAETFEVFCPDRRGHGRTPDVPGPISYEVMARDTVGFLEHRMHRAEPTMTVADLAGYPGPALVMIGDEEDEIPLEHMVALRSGLPDAQLGVVPRPVQPLIVGGGRSPSAAEQRTGL